MIWGKKNTSSFTLFTNTVLNECYEENLSLSFPLPSQSSNIRHGVWIGTDVWLKGRIGLNSRLRKFSLIIFKQPLAGNPH